MQYAVWDYSDHCKASVFCCLKTSHGERSTKMTELYEIEKEMSSLGMVERPWVSRKPPSR